MVLLDTNVVSEVMRPEPAGAVIRWLNDIDSGSLHITSITIGEIDYCISCLREGERSETLESRFMGFVERGFAESVRDFYELAARYYGAIMGESRRHGRPISAPDAQIAAVARQHGMAVGTRNVVDFQEIGLELINPWDSGF